MVTISGNTVRALASMENGSRNATVCPSGGLWLLTCPISKMILMICWKVWREIYLKSGEGLGGRTKMPPLLCMSSTLRR